MVIIQSVRSAILKEENLIKVWITFNGKKKTNYIGLNEYIGEMAEVEPRTVLAVGGWKKGRGAWFKWTHNAHCHKKFEESHLILISPDRGGRLYIALSDTGFILIYSFEMDIESFFFFFYPHCQSGPI